MVCCTVLQPAAKDWEADSGTCVCPEHLLSPRPGAPADGTGKLNGRSELLLGKFIEEYPGSERVRSSIRVATKIAPYPWRLTRKQARRRATGWLRGRRWGTGG